MLSVSYRRNLAALLLVSLFLGMLAPINAAAALEPNPGSTNELASLYSEPGQGLTDLDEFDRNTPYIKYLYNQGIITGTPDGSFQADQALSRAAAVTAISRLMHTDGQELPAPAPAPAPFIDVASGYWASEYINAAYTSGLVTGYEDQTFRPEQYLNRAEGVSMALRLSKEATDQARDIQMADVLPGFWAYDNVNTAVDSGMLRMKSLNSAAPNENMTRGEFARALAVLVTTDPEYNKCELQGEISSFSGEVSLVRNGQEVEVSIGEKVLINDQIKTGAQGSLEIVYPDGSGLKVMPETEFSIKKSDGRHNINWDGSASQTVEMLNLDLKVGSVFAALASRADTASGLHPGYENPVPGGSKWYEDESDSSRVRLVIDLPWGVAAIKGTFVLVTVLPSGACELSCLVGVAELNSLVAGSLPTQVGPGMSSVILQLGALPGAAAPMSQEQLDNWNANQEWVFSIATAIAAAGAGQEQNSVPPEGYDQQVQEFTSGENSSGNDPDGDTSSNSTDSPPPSSPYSQLLDIIAAALNNVTVQMQNTQVVPTNFIYVPMNTLSDSSSSSNTPPPFILGNGSAASPFQVGTAEQFNAIRGGIYDGMDMSKHYVLTGDIDLSGISGGSPGTGGADPGGWVPLGMDISDPTGNTFTPFTGSLDGQGHVITGLTIDRSADFQGLFACIGDGSAVGSGYINSLNLADIDVKGGHYVGGLAGHICGSSIEGCSVNGEVDTNGLSGPCHGLLAGDVLGTMGGPLISSITDCQVQGSVQGDDETGGMIGNSHLYTISNCAVTVSGGPIEGSAYVGGLVGCFDGGSIDNCDVNALNNWNVISSDLGIGGLTGLNGGTIANCSSSVDVISTVNPNPGDGNISEAGGLVGRNETDGSILYCQASGSVTADGGVYGGLVGSNFGEINYSQSHGDVNYDDSVVAIAADAGGLVGSNQHGIIDNCWSDSDVSGISFDTGGLVGMDGSGIISNSYAIGDVSTCNGGCVTGGLVGCAMTGSQISDSYFAGTVTTSGVKYTGGLVGINYGIIRDCSSSASVISSDSFTGGLTGSNDGSIDTSAFYGTVDSNGIYTGGVTGKNEGTLTSCCLEGSVLSQQILTGGIAGGNLDTGIIHNCSVRIDSVQGTDSVGGICGSNLGSIQECSVETKLMYDIDLINIDYGWISGDSNIGGICGINEGNIFRCCCRGYITSDSNYPNNIGGICGYNDPNGVIQDCYTRNFSDGFPTYIDCSFEPPSHIGGIAGWNQGTIETCYSQIVLGCSGTSYEGGIAGGNEGQMSYCIAAMPELQVSLGSDHVGRITGINSGTINDCYANDGMLCSGFTPSYKTSDGIDGADYEYNTMASASNDIYSWDLAWQYLPGQNLCLPVLSWQSPEPGNWTGLWGSGNPADPQYIGNPVAIAADPGGYIYVADSLASKVFCYDPNMQSVSEVCTAPGVLRGLAFGPDGKLYMSTPVSVSRVDPAIGQPSLVTLVTSGPNDARGLEVDNSGFIYVCDGNQVKKFNSSGDPAYFEGNGLTFLGRDDNSSGNGSSEFNQPMDVVIDDNGYIYIADQLNCVIKVFDPSGNPCSMIGVMWLTAPVALDLDSQNRLYVCDFGKQRVCVFREDGCLDFCFGAPGIDDGGFQSISGIAVSPGGLVPDQAFVADQALCRVQQFVQ